MSDNKENQINRKYNKFKLIYSEDRGKADLIKLIFSINNCPYEDLQIKQTDWSVYKQYMPFEQLPVLIVNDEFKVGQVNTICRFLAKCFNLNGESEMDSVLCDMVIEQLRECVDQAVLSLQETDAQRRNSLLKKFTTETLAKTLSGFEKMMGVSNSRFIVGGRLTWADLALVNAWEWLDDHSRQLIQCYPLVKRHYEFMRNLNDVKEWYSRQRPLRVNKII